MTTNREYTQRREDVEEEPATVPAMEQSPPRSDSAAAPAPVSEPSPPPPKPGKGSRIGAIVVLALIVASLVWYFVSDRLTPYTSQARVQAFVVPVAAEVAG